MHVLGDHYHLIARGRLSAEQISSGADCKTLASLLRRAMEEHPWYGETPSDRDVRLLRVSVRGPASGEGAIFEAHLEPGLRGQGERVSKFETHLLRGSVQIDKNRDIKVAGQWQGWGIGRIMLSHWVAWAQLYHPGIDVVPILPVLERKAELRKFYGQFGFDWAWEGDNSDPIVTTALRRAEPCSIAIRPEEMVPALWEALDRAIGQIHELNYHVGDYKRRLGLSGSLWSRLNIALRGPS